ncbi:MAG TPA: TonB-dependent receptor [Vicinamibacterales bacterium]|nr:TonB-dependent receptor [Vicinamibacterales bacterium]
MGFARFVAFPYLVIGWLSLAAVSVAAQAQLAGTVVDENGGALPRVAVTLVDQKDVEVATTFTDSQGAFRFARRCDGCAVIVSIPGFNPARSAVSTDSAATITLTVAPVRESVVVSATRTETPTSQVGAAVTVFTAEEMERRDMPVVAELLRGTPGATVVRAGGVGNVTSLFVRGGESSYNKVLLDGIPLNEPGGTFNFSNLTTDFVERIEVVRGAQSALFGSDAMSSVVQLISKRPARGLLHPTILASGEAGSYDSRRGSASVGVGGGKWDGSLHAGRQHTANRVPNNEFDNTTITGNGGVMPSSNVSVRLVGRTEFGRTGVPGATAFGRPDLDAFFHRRDGVIGATLEHQISERWQQRIAYAVSVSHQQSTNLNIDPPYVPRFDGHVAPFTFSDFPYDSLTDLRRHFVTYQADARVGSESGHDQMLTFAFDVNAERGVLTNRMASSVVRASRDNFGWTAQHQWFGARASIASGLRIEHNDSFGTVVAPRISIAVAAAANTKLKFNAGLGVKEPTILQSFSPSPSFLGNPDLDPERATTVDAGIEQRLFAQRVKIEAIWFDARYKNIISTRTISFTPFLSQYFNIGLTKAHGAELAFDTAPAAALRVRGGYTLTVSRIAESTSPTNPVFAVGAWAFRRPRHSGFVEAVWTADRFAADLRGTFIGRRVDSDFSSLVPPIVENAGYQTWDAGASYSIVAPLALYLRVDNLADRDYMDPLGYPAWKRAARAGARVSW